MFLRRWDDLPEFLKNEEVKCYYDLLRKKRVSLFMKRLFDIFLASILIVILAPMMTIIAILIKSDSKGKIFFRQERVTRYGKRFRIHKFRTMVENAEEKGNQITSYNDERITSIGKVLRKYRIDEIPQLIDVLKGDMTFVGTRPEVVKYVRAYDLHMRATLLMPAGITSRASIFYKDEDTILSKTKDVDEVYIKEILPEKMKYNLDELLKFSLIRDLKTMFKTIIAVLK